MSRPQSNLRGLTHERRMERTVLSQPPLSADTTERALDARYGSERLLESMEASFAMFARQHKVDLLDARTLLMNATGL